MLRAERKKEQADPHKKTILTSNMSALQVLKKNEIDDSVPMTKRSEGMQHYSSTQIQKPVAQETQNQLLHLRPTSWTSPFYPKVSTK